MSNFPIEQGHVLAFARALGADPSPDGGVPLTFPIAYAHFDPDWPLVMRPGQPWHGSGAEPGTSRGGGGLHAEQGFEYFRPLRVGESLTIHKRQGRTWTKEGRSGVLDFAERHTDFHDAAGELVARATTVTVVKRTEKSGRGLPNRTSGERDANQPQVRDQTTPSSANVTNTLNSGEAERSRVVVSDLKRTQIAMYAGASGDFNPLHTDEPFATRVAGNPTVMSHGMLVMGMAGELLADWFGTARVRRYRARFQAPTWPGDTISVTARVEAIANVDGERRAEVSVQATSKDGTVAVLSGSATVVLG